MSAEGKTKLDLCYGIGIQNQICSLALRVSRPPLKDSVLMILCVGAKLKVRRVNA